MKDFRELDRAFDRGRQSKISIFWDLLCSLIRFFFEGELLDFIRDVKMDLKFNSFKREYIMQHEDIRREIEMSHRIYVQNLRNLYEEDYVVNVLKIDLKKYD
ncbi:MAG: hypothetical protein IJ666_01570 [Ruminococcus sp.]|nr:hypothetical protein [Ruminococcus sp.]